MAIIFAPPPPRPSLTGFLRPLEPLSSPDFQAQGPPSCPDFWKQQAIEKTQHFILKIPVYYNFQSLKILGFKLQHFEIRLFKRLC